MRGRIYGGRQLRGNTPEKQKWVSQLDHRVELGTVGSTDLAVRAHVPATSTQRPLSSSTRKKIERLRAGKPLRVVDLFAGCGGLSLGFKAAGFELLGAVEYDELAVASHALNFFSHLAPEQQKVHATALDITKIDPEWLLKHLPEEAEYQGTDIATDEAVDVVIGGPPCQAFSIVGRAKLRAVNNHPLAFKVDSRAELYKDFLRFVSAYRPLAVLIENVPEILRFGEHNVAEQIASELEELGYAVRYTVLNSVHYGVPQLRDRMFMIAFLAELNLQPSFPEPSHKYALPRGYRNLRNDVTSKLAGGLFGSRYFQPPIENTTKGVPAVTAQDAIGDLAPITLHLEGKLKRGARRFTEVCPYPVSRHLSSYAKLMREWPGFENSTGVKDHLIRYLPRDYKIFARMQPGDEYPQAHAVAELMFQEELERRSSAGETLLPGTEEYQRLRKAFVPPYDPKKFANKWRKIDANEPVRTITAHIGKDSYSHIHYSSQQARTISVREAARLQSFPDGFQYVGTLDPALRQIGNSVPPLMSKALAVRIRDDLAALVRLLENV